MDVITFDLLEMHRHGSAFQDYLALRKQFFVDTLNWGIPHDATVEMDQYDNPKASYAIVLKDGEVVAGARTLPTTARWGDHTYMLRDAFKGRLSTIPSGLIDSEIETNEVWECTRLVIADSVKGLSARQECLNLIVEGLSDIARPHGGTTLMSLSNLWLLRALRRLGHDAELMCEPYRNDDDGHKYAVMSIPVTTAPVDVIEPLFAIPAPAVIQAIA